MSEENVQVEPVEPIEPVNQSLLGDNNAPTELAEGEFYLADGVKGVGEKPEWYDGDRFKSVDQQAKSYMELEKKFGSFTGAPKDGYTLPEGVDKDDALASDFIKLASELNMNQGGFDKGFELLSAQMGASQEINQEAEMAKLGDNAGQRIEILDNALKNKLGEGYNDVKDLITSADSIILAEKLMTAHAPVKLPIDGGDHPQGLTWADIEVEMNKKDGNGRFLRSTDQAHNLKVERMMKEFGGDKVTGIAVG